MSAVDSELASRLRLGGAAVTQSAFPDSHARAGLSLVRRALVAALTLAVFLSISRGDPSARQNPPGPEGSATGQTPRFRTETNFVRVDVYATRDGVPVRDLTRDDFAVLENNVPQRVETFEHVDIRGWTPQEQRREPESAAEGRAMAEDPRARVFVVFLDTYHTDVTGSYYMQRAIVNLLDRLIGPNDVFAVMTPHMSAKDLSFARKTDTTAGMLQRYWYWGTEDRRTKEEPEEQDLLLCYGSPAVQDRSSDTGHELVARRRELRVLDALDDLAITLRGVREERKAVVAITSGWRLYEPSPALLNAEPDNRPPPIPIVGVGPDGRLSGDRNATESGHFRQKCTSERLMLAMIDNNKYLREIIDRANRANVSFYPLDAQGLRSWNSDLGSQPVDAPAWYEQDVLKFRIDTLRLLAGGTDGLAVIDTNDFNRGMRRIVEDLSSYYLLGYYSSNDRLDGKFRSIKVRVRKPGVEIRARRGYLAPTRDEVDQARQLQAAAAISAPTTAVQTAIASLGAVRQDSPLLTRVSWVAGETGSGHVWVTAEPGGRPSAAGWDAGAAADVILTAGSDGETVASARETAQPPARVVSLSLPQVTLLPGLYRVQVRVKPEVAPAAVGDTASFEVSAADETGPPRLLRRGPTTGAAYVATANPFFRRTERIRTEAPLTTPAESVSAELLDRNGNVMSVPVEASVAAADRGLAGWARAEVALAPLAPGVYVIRTIVERPNRRQEVLAAFRVVP